MNTKYTDEQLMKIIDKHEKVKKWQSAYMTNRYKNDIEFSDKVKNRSKIWYQNNKKEKKEYYEKNKEYTHKMRRYRYALKTDTLDRYKLKYPEEYQNILHS